MTLPSTKERAKKALQMRLEGKTFKEIGESLGVGAYRASQLVTRGERSVDAPKQWAEGLRTGIQRALEGHGIHSREALLVAFQEQSIWPGNPEKIGEKAMDEIAEWLGIQRLKQIAVDSDAKIQRAIALLERNGYKVEKTNAR